MGEASGPTWELDPLCIRARTRVDRRPLRGGLRRSRVEVGGPGAERAAVVADHAQQSVGQIRGIEWRHVDRWLARLADWRESKVGKIGVAARLPGRLIFVVSTSDFVARFDADRSEQEDCR